MLLKFNTMNVYNNSRSTIFYSFHQLSPLIHNIVFRLNKSEYLFKTQSKKLVF